MAAKGAPGEVHDSQQNPLGMEAWFYDTINNVLKKYIYLAGVASTIAGSWISYDENGATTGLDTDVAASLVGPVAIATAAVVASKYGWYGRDGAFSAGAATVADNAKVFPTSTVFICDDTSVAGSQIVPAIWRSADSAGLATVEIHDPFVGINVA
jgi:hypothetical protein